MEQEEQKASIFSFGFDETSKEHIKTIGIWAAIIAVLALVILLLNITFYVVASRTYYPAQPKIFLGFIPSSMPILAGQAVLSIILNVFLFMVSVHLRKGLQNLDSKLLGKGFSSLRTYYKMYGILLIILTILFILYALYRTSSPL